MDRNAMIEAAEATIRRQDVGDEEVERAIEAWRDATSS